MILVVDSTTLNLAKHACAQLKEFGVETETVEADYLDIPRIVAQREADAYLVALETDKKFTDQVVGKILDLEEDRYVEKMFIEKGSTGREVFERRSVREIQEKAERLAERVQSKT